MAQAFDRLVRRPALLALAPLLLAGCQCIFSGPPATACPEVTEAEAWVNRMPSIGGAPSRMIVSLRVAGEDPWMLKPMETNGEEDGLALELVPGGNSLPGTIAYRQTPPSPLPDAIRIMCQGEEIAIIDEILIVQ